jgi:formylglycine-generating enzyme required for sulfatase activity
MLPSRLLNGLFLATFLVLPVQAAASSPTLGKTSPAGVCASLAACEVASDRALAANDIESLAMALWRKIAVLQEAGKRDEADAVRRYLVAVLSQTHGPEHADTVAARNATPEVAMQALLPAWQQRQRQNAESEARRGPILERLRAGKNMVKIAEAYFEIGQYEVTQAEWEAVMGTDPSHFRGCADCPVENIDGDTVRAFLVKLNQLTGKQYRLPTDKERWRVFEAGFSGSADDNAWHAGNAGGRTHPVGQKKPNVLGLYDLQGNVSEWVTNDDHLTNAGSSWDAKTPVVFWTGVEFRSPRYPTLGFRLAHSLDPKKYLPACHDLPGAPKPVSPSAGPSTSLPKGFRDCPDCPEMVPIPAGHAEDTYGAMTAVPAFAIARTEVTVGQFRRFAEATGHRTSAENNRCNAEGQDWRRPGHAQTDAHPVVCISGRDAKAYVDWLSKLTGQTYLIPTHLQWEHAARGGSTDLPWGENIKTACRFANLHDRCSEATFVRKDVWDTFPCNDGYAYPAPVGNFPPNTFGLFDMLGNVEEWASDCHDCGYDFRARGGGVWSGTYQVSFASITNYGEQQSPHRGFRPVRVAPR